MDLENPPLRQIDQPASLADGRVFRLRLAEGADDLHLLIRLKFRRRLAMDVKQGIFRIGHRLRLCERRPRKSNDLRM